MSELENIMITILTGTSLLGFFTFVGTVLYYSWKDARTDP